MARADLLCRAPRSVSRPSRSVLSCWRIALFAFMSRNSVHPVDRFRIPPNALVEIGRRIELYATHTNSRALIVRVGSSDRVPAQGCKRGQLPNRHQPLRRGHCSALAMASNVSGRGWRAFAPVGIGAASAFMFANLTPGRTTFLLIR
jgi:hypothetical protein